MSSIEERIQKHELQMRILSEKITRHNTMVLKWQDKYGFHKKAIDNLNIKKAKQEKKVD